MSIEINGKNAAIVTGAAAVAAALSYGGYRLSQIVKKTLVAKKAKRRASDDYQAGKDERAAA